MSPDDRPVEIYPSKNKAKKETGMTHPLLMECLDDPNETDKWGCMWELEDEQHNKEFGYFMCNAELTWSLIA